MTTTPNLPNLTDPNIDVIILRKRMPNLMPGLEKLADLVDDKKVPLHLAGARNGFNADALCDMFGLPRGTNLRDPKIVSNVVDTIRSFTGRVDDLEQWRDDHESEHKHLNDGIAGLVNKVRRLTDMKIVKKLPNPWLILIPLSVWAATWYFMAKHSGLPGHTGIVGFFLGLTGFGAFWAALQGIAKIYPKNDDYSPNDTGHASHSTSPQSPASPRHRS